MLGSIQPSGVTPGFGARCRDHPASHPGISGVGLSPTRPCPTGVGADSGSSTVEAILVVPVLMVILLVVIQVALWAHAAQVVQLAASEGDRAARSLGGSAAAGVAQAQSVVHASGSDLAVSGVTVDVLPGGLERITITGHAVSILPGFALPVSATDVGPIQEFRASG